MRKTGTWYFMVLTGLFFLVGRAIGYLNHEVTRTYQMYLEGSALPVLTNLVIRIHAWPYIAATLSAGLSVAGFASPIKSHILVHIAFWFAIITGAILLATACGYCFPFVPIISEMKP